MDMGEGERMPMKMYLPGAKPRGMGEEGGMMMLYLPGAYQRRMMGEEGGMLGMLYLPGAQEMRMGEVIGRLVKMMTREEGTGREEMDLKERGEGMSRRDQQEQAMMAILGQKELGEQRRKTPKSLKIF